MNPQNTGYDLHSFVLGYLEEGIKKNGLAIGKEFGGTVTLSNGNCVIFVQSSGEGVGFFFASLASPTQKFSISDYLDLNAKGGYLIFFPRLPEGIANDERFSKAFQSFNEVLLSTEMDAPLAGDFSWASRLIAQKEEYETLESKMFDLIEDEHPEGLALRKKWANDDLTWMDDVRRISAEQESKP